MRILPVALLHEAAAVRQRLPELLSRAAVIRQDELLLLLVVSRGQEKPLAPQDRRRMPPSRHIDRPDYILLVAERERNILRPRDPVQFRPPPPRPIVRRHLDRRKLLKVARIAADFLHSRRGAVLCHRADGAEDKTIKTGR